MLSQFFVIQLVEVSVFIVKVAQLFVFLVAVFTPFVSPIIVDLECVVVLLIVDLLDSLTAKNVLDVQV